MPKVAYSEAERAHIREVLIAAALEQLAKHGMQHMTVEQVYRAAGISRTFFYSFFPTKEDLVLETLYFQQPKVLSYARGLMDDPALSWREGVTRFFYACCYGEESGIAVLRIEDQQLLARRLSPESYRVFREKQQLLFSRLLDCFGVQADKANVGLFTNLSLAMMIMRRAIPQTLPFFVPEAAAETVAFQIHALVDYLEKLRG